MKLAALVIMLSALFNVSAFAGKKEKHDDKKAEDMAKMCEDAAHKDSEECKKFHAEHAAEHKE
jgi:hypothetical protein